MVASCRSGSGSGSGRMSSSARAAACLGLSALMQFLRKWILIGESTFARSTDQLRAHRSVAGIRVGICMWLERSGVQSNV
eukprot:jgi/Picsp_1/2149/NSC_05614-R1_---NA---